MLMAKHTSPVYNIHQSDKMYSLEIDLPGVKASDMSMKLMDNNVLHLSGGRKFRDDTSVEESKFGYRFNLSDKNLDTDKLEANLYDGVLKIKVPFFEQQETIEPREIEIVEGGDEETASLESISKVNAKEVDINSDK